MDHRFIRRHTQRHRRVNLKVVVALLLLLSRKLCAFLSPTSSDRSRERLRPNSALETITTVSSGIPLSLRGRRSKPFPRQVEAPMPIVGYDIATINKYYDRRPFHVGWRLNTLGFPLLGWYIGLLIDRLLGIDKHESTQRKRGEELRNHLINSGSVALIKSGQALSLRPDLLRNKIWAEELGKLVDEVGPFSDTEAMKIMKREMADLLPRLQAAKKVAKLEKSSGMRLHEVKSSKQNGIVGRFGEDLILGLFEFSNDKRAVASASIGQVYKATIKRGVMLEAAIGKIEAARWGGKTVSIKIQRPDVAASAALDIYLLRRAAEWMSRWRGGNLPAIADQFGLQLFGELDYVREAHNCERFKVLYGDWDSVKVPSACRILTRKKVLILEWIDGIKGPWDDTAGIEMVRIGLKCSVDQLLHTGVFHADPHRGNLLRTARGNLAFLDFGMMADVPEKDRYGLIGLVIGLQNKDLPLVTDNLLKLGFLQDTTQLGILVPRLRQALLNATGGTGKASDVNFARLQAELEEISRENVLKFSTPPFFTIIIRSLTILEGLALSVDSNFRLVRGAYPFVVAQLLSQDENEPANPSLTKLLTYFLTVNGEGERIEWARLRDFLRLAQKAAKLKSWKVDAKENGSSSSRQTINLFIKFLTSKSGLFLKVPLVHELSEAVDGMASLGEASLLRISRGLVRPLPGGNGPVNAKRMEEIRSVIEMLGTALVEGSENMPGGERLEAMVDVLQDFASFVQDEEKRGSAAPVLIEISTVVQMVAVEVLEIRGSRAMRSVLRLLPTG